MLNRSPWGFLLYSYYRKKMCTGFVSMPLESTSAVAHDCAIKTSELSLPICWVCHPQNYIVTRTPKEIADSMYINRIILEKLGHIHTYFAHQVNITSCKVWPMYRPNLILWCLNQNLPHCESYASHVTWIIHHNQWFCFQNGIWRKYSWNFYPFFCVDRNNN